MSPHAPIPVLEPMLQPGESILLQVETAATTVLDGPGGFLQFRRWEAVQPAPVGPTILPGLVWKVVDEFVLGAMGRECLRELLNENTIAEPPGGPSPALLEFMTEAGHRVGERWAKGEEVADVVSLMSGFVPSGATKTATLIAQATMLGASFSEQIKRDWYGTIMAEAATTFADGGTVIEQTEYVSLTEAKAWVVKRLAELLAAEEHVSQAVVLGPGGVGYELSPAAWPHPGFSDAVAEWIVIEVDDSSEEG